jgi:hypothetical protein
MFSFQVQDFYSPDCICYKSRPFFNNSHTVSRETLQLHDVKEAVMRRGAFELPCFNKATVIRMDLGFLGIALPPAGVFHALRVMRLEHFWFRGQLSLIDTMLPSLRDLFIRRVRGLTILMLSSKSLLDIHLCLLHELRRLNILAPRLEELEVTGCFYVPDIRTKSIFIVNTILLFKTFCNETNFVPVNSVIYSFLDCNLSDFD